jgi:MinD-like ATPase involved in chromosome partitioning or flagellar assembly
MDEQAVQAAVNHGTPFIVRDENRPISQSIRQFAEHIRSVLTAEPDEEVVEEREAAADRLRLSRVFG